MTSTSLLPVETFGKLMKPIAGGSIKLRDDRLGKQWTANLQPFLCCAVPITWNCYAQVMEISLPSDAGPSHPVHSVSWLDAASFCNRLSERSALPCRYLFSVESNDVGIVHASTGFRLLTEAEWEFACRAGTDAPRYAPIEEIAWYRANSEGSTRPVAMKRPNPWGLYDMLGNVWEWCEDIYDPNVYGTYRTFRGGGWADEERGCLATNRRRSHPTFAIDDLGFRVARSIV